MITARALLSLVLELTMRITLVRKFRIQKV